MTLVEIDEQQDVMIGCGDVLSVYMKVRSS
jgi:hypothetical protein